MLLGCSACIPLCLHLSLERGVLVVLELDEMGVREGKWRPDSLSIRIYDTVPESLRRTARTLASKKEGVRAESGAA
jgi:hypothetical protein